MYLVLYIVFQFKPCYVMLMAPSLLFPARFTAVPIPTTAPVTVKPRPGNWQAADVACKLAANLPRLCYVSGDITLFNLFGNALIVGVPAASVTLGYGSVQCCFV